ncbi:condensation domain-containing protein [Amycolatopsis sp. NEAU-NG30]|uniref:Condensation domain-containing protein n=1 Tax=Amycolatopsis melonis TaxID=3156488 RepID=A0ABV0LBE7_9PSEU
MTAPRTGFLFPGQSSEYAGMGVELHREHAVFRTAVDRHAGRFRRLTGTGPLDVFADPAAQARAELLQPAVFLLQVALAEFWMACGVFPDAVLGHSLGEYAAACVAGVFDVEDGLELVSARGRAFAAVSGTGRMVAVGDPDPAELERLVAAHGGAASVAAYNAPGRMVVSGTDPAMDELVAAFGQRGWLTIPLETTHAFHSALVAPAVPALAAAAERIGHRAPAVPPVLNLTGDWAADGEPGPRYWGRQLTAPVRFQPGVRALLDDGCTVFLEVGSGRTLTTAGRAQSTGNELWLAGLSPRTPDPATVLDHLTRLEEAGIPVDWVRFHAPSRAAGQVTGLEFRAVGQAAGLPSGGIGQAAGLPSEATGQSAAGLPSRAAGQTTGLPSEATGQSAAGLPSRGIGQAAGLPSQATGQSAAGLPSEATGRTAAELPSQTTGQTAAELPFRIERVVLHEPAGTATSGVAVVRHRAAGEVVDVSVVDGTGRPVAEVFGLELHRRPIDRGVTPMTEHPLSYAQSSMLVLHRMDPDSAAYNVALTARFTGGFDPAAFHRALQSLAGRHAALRTTFSHAGRQIVHDRLDPDFAELDASRWTGGELRDAVRAAYREPFALLTGSPLRVRAYRVAPGEAVVLLAAHHAVCDFWSLGTMLAELEQLYAAEVEQRPAELPENPKPYSDFVTYQRELIADERGARARAYWHSRLSGPLEPAEWPRFDLDPADTDGGDQFQFPLPPELAAEVFALAKAEAVTPYVVLLTAFQLLVGRYTGRRDVLVGSPFAGRTDPTLTDCVGNFVNSVVLRADLGDALSFREQLARTRRTVAEAFQHQDYPFELLVSELAPRRVDGRNPIFQAMFIYQKSGRHPAHAALHLADETVPTAGWAGLSVTPFPLSKQDNQVELTLEVVHDGDRLAGVLKYRKSVFSPAAAGRAAEHYVTLLQAAVADPGRSVVNLPLLTEAAQHAPAPVAPDGSLAARFRQAAQQHAHRPAVRCDGDQLTYAELDELTGRWAARLRAEGAGPGSRVAVRLEPSLDAVVAIVAIQRAGAASVVLDPSSPAAPEACVVLTQPDLAGQPAGVPVLVMAETELPPSGDVACSGYEGFDVTHGDVLTRLESLREHVDETAVVAFGHPAVSELPLWSALLAGACVVVVPPGATPDFLHSLLVAERVTHLVLTPSALHGLSEVVQRTGTRGLALRHVFSTGEPLPAPLARTAREWCGTLWNTYAPAGTTVWVTAQPVGPEDCTGTTVPVGFPLADTGIHVLDEHGQPVPPEFTGELHLGGPPPLSRTGDLARVDSRGRLEILGHPGADDANPVAVTGVAAAPSDHERRVAAVWQQVLNRRDIGREDNFFDIGGNSLLLLQVYELLSGDTADPPLKGSEMFRYPTVASLAARLGSADTGGRDRTSGRRARPADDTVRGARLRARQRGGRHA